MLEINVVGTPTPQGSKTAYPVKGRGGKIRCVIVETSGKRLKEWRKAVLEAAVEAIDAAGWQAPEGPVRVSLDFYMERPKGHYRTGANAHLLRSGAPEFPHVRPDGDKLQRAVFDALTKAKAYEDDARVVEGTWRKRYADTRAPGVVVRVTAL